MAGLEVTRDQDPVRAAQIEQWADQVAGVYNILPMDAVTFRLWAQLMRHRSEAPYEDAMIAESSSIRY